MSTAYADGACRGPFRNLPNRGVMRSDGAENGPDGRSHQLFHAGLMCPMEERIYATALYRAGPGMAASNYERRRERLR